MKNFMLKNIIAATIIVTTMSTLSPISASAAYWNKSSDIESTTLLQKTIAENSVLGSNSSGESKSRSSNSEKTNENTSDNNNNSLNNTNGNISNDNKDNGESEFAQEPSFVKNIRITSVGPVKYISIVFAKGIIDDYIYYIDESDVTDLFTKVSTEGNVVKYELQGGEKELLLKQKSTGKKSIYIIK